MSIPEIAELLKETALDRETKRQIIDILAVNPDPKVAADIEALLVSFNDADKEADRRLAERIADIESARTERLKASAAGLDRELRALQDEISGGDEIERIRRSIKGL